MKIKTYDKKYKYVIIDGENLEKSEDGIRILSKFCWVHMREKFPPYIWRAL